MHDNSNKVQLRDMDVTVAHVLKHAGYDTALRVVIPDHPRLFSGGGERGRRRTTRRLSQPRHHRHLSGGNHGRHNGR